MTKGEKGAKIRTLMTNERAQGSSPRGMKSQAKKIEKSFKKLLTFGNEHDIINKLTR